MIAEATTTTAEESTVAKKSDRGGNDTSNATPNPADWSGFRRAWCNEGHPEGGNNRKQEQTKMKHGQFPFETIRNKPPDARRSMVDLTCPA